MAAKVSRNNVIAGLFVVGAMVLALVISIVVSGAGKRLASTRSYTIRFSLIDGASGLKAGSPVTLGGQEVGRVTGISFAGQAESPAIAGVDVKVAVRSDIRVHQDAWAFLERPLLGSMSAINFSSLGGSAPRLEPGGTLIGVVAPPAFLAQAGYGPEQINQVKQIILQATEAVESISRIAKRLEQDIDPDLKAIRAAIDDISTMTSEWRAKSPEWMQRVDSILASADALFEENRGPFKHAVTALDEALTRFRDETMVQAGSMIESARAGADEFREANARLNRLLKQEEPNIQRILANFRLASDEIKLAGIEVRRSPWKLLYSPTTKELESELFYDAARTYASAVSDLRAASEALENVSGPAAEPIAARLQEAFTKYEAAERELLKRMTERK
jgi:hypothetical protein